MTYYVLSPFTHLRESKTTFIQMALPNFCKHELPNHLRDSSASLNWFIVRHNKRLSILASPAPQAEKWTIFLFSINQTAIKIFLGYYTEKNPTFCVPVALSKSLRWSLVSVESCRMKAWLQSGSTLLE